MKEKCSKYEALFVFGAEAALKEHLETCAHCRKEQEKFDRVSELIREAAPAFKRKRQFVMQLKAACILFAVMVVGTVSFNSYNSESLSAEDLGFPVDAYGLITVGG